MDGLDIEEVRQSIAGAMQGSTDAPKIFNSYEPASIPRERRESFLGDSPTGAFLPPDPDPDTGGPSNAQGGGGTAGGDIDAVMYLASEGALVNVTLKGTINP